MEKRKSKPSSKPSTRATPKYLRRRPNPETFYRRTQDGPRQSRLLSLSLVPPQGPMHPADDSEDSFLKERGNVTTNSNACAMAHENPNRIHKLFPWKDLRFLSGAAARRQGGPLLHPGAETRNKCSSAVRPDCAVGIFRPAPCGVASGSPEQRQRRTWQRSGKAQLDIQTEDA